MPDQEDLDLVRAARAGDKQALDTLLRRHYERLHALCRRLTGNDADALDACQEALIAVARGLARFDERSSFITWSYRVATNACFDELRRRRRRPEPGLPPLLADSTTVDEAVVARLDVDAALARLSKEFRVAVTLRDLCGLSYAEIGEVLQVPVGTVRSRIARGRASLVPLLEGNRTRPLERPTSS